MENGEALPRFNAVLSQLREDLIPGFASSVRLFKSSVSIPCKLVIGPLHGSFNMAYRIVFEDGIQWLLKIPHNGHAEGWNDVAAKGLRTEFHTMGMIKNRTSIPLPAVHDYDDSLENDIGCPFIMMDFIEGEPLYKVWFNEKQNPLKLDMIRARALQTLASAMVQLTAFGVAYGGAVYAKTVDIVAMMEEPYSEENPDPLCEKGPSVDPLSFSTFTIDRYLSRCTTSAQERGTLEMLRIFMGQVFKSAQLDGKQFCLTHPDLDTQNIIVKEDGTLCSLIDCTPLYPTHHPSIHLMRHVETNVGYWKRDGALAVPNAVGPLSYPKFLIRDWNPYFYKRDLDRRIEMEPEEVEKYRVMYAQFIEMAKGREAADVTRASVIAANLDAAANNFNLLDGLLDKIFEDVASLTEAASTDGKPHLEQRDQIGAKHYDEECAEVESGDDDVEHKSSGGEEDVGEDDEEDKHEEEHGGEEEEISQGNTDTPNTDLDDSTNKSEAVPVEGSYCPKFTPAETGHSNVQRQAETAPPPLDQPQSLALQRSASPAPEDKPIDRPVKSRRSRIAQGFLAVTGQGCRFAASKLHRNTLSELGEARPTSMDPQAPSRERSIEVSNEDGFKESLGQMAINLRDVARGLHKEQTELKEAEDEKEAEAQSADLTFQQNNAQTPSPRPALPDSQHSKGCTKARQTALRSNELKTEEESQPAGPTIKDAWERIALEVKNCGIRDATIKAYQPKIAGLIIDAMRAEQRQVDDFEEARKTFNRETERKSKKELEARQARQALEALETQEAMNATIANDRDLRIPEMEGDGPSNAGKLIAYSSEKPTFEAGPRGPPLLKKRRRIPRDEAISEGIAVRNPILGKRERSRIIQLTKVDHIGPDEPPTGSLKVSPKRPGQGDTLQESVGIPATAETNAAAMGSDVSRDRLRSEARATALSIQRAKTATVPSSVYAHKTHLGPASKSIARNKPCPCGSKHKFKKCCGRGTKLTPADSVKDVETHTDQAEYGDQGSEFLEDSSSGESIPTPTTNEYLRYLSEREASHPASQSSTSNLTALRYAQVSDEEDEGIDIGAFTLGDVCIALGEGNLDQLRLGRLEEGFKGLLDGLTGKG